MQITYLWHNKNIYNQNEKKNRKIKDIYKDMPYKMNTEIKCKNKNVNNTSNKKRKTNANKMHK